MEKLSATKFKMLNLGEKHNNHLSRGGIVYAQAAIRQKLPIPMKPFRLSSFYARCLSHGARGEQEKAVGGSKIEAQAEKIQSIFVGFLIQFLDEEFFFFVVSGWPFLCSRSEAAREMNEKSDKSDT